MEVGGRVVDRKFCVETLCGCAVGCYLLSLYV